MKIIVLGSKGSSSLPSLRAELEISGHTVVGLAFDNFVGEAAEERRISIDKEPIPEGHKGERASAFYKLRAIAEAKKKDASEKQQIYGHIAASDAVLVVNEEKSGTKGYIGATVLMEMAVAHAVGKPIIILHPLPDSDTLRWVQDVKMLHPTVLDGTLKHLPSSSLHWAGLG